MAEQKAAAGTVADMESDCAPNNQEGEEEEEEEEAVALDVSPFASLVASMCGGGADGSKKKTDQLPARPPSEGGAALNR